MTQRLALLCDELEDAKSVVRELHARGYTDENIYVITRQDITMDELPEADPRQYSDVVSALKRGAGVGGTMGLFAGVLVATTSAGLALGGAAIPALAAGGALFGAWTSSMVGIGLPNSKLEEFHEAVEEGRTLVLVDADEDGADALLEHLGRTCRAEIVVGERVEAL